MDRDVKIIPSHEDPCSETEVDEMRSKFVLFSLMAAQLTALSLTASAFATPWKVQPGVGVGPILIGKELKGTDTALTRTDTVNSLGKTKDQWALYKEGLEVEVLNGNVLQISVAENQVTGKQGPIEFELDPGIKIGSTVQQMEMAFGRNYQSRVLDQSRGTNQAPETYFAYVNKGLGFLVRNNKVFKIIIWPKK